MTNSPETQQQPRNQLDRLQVAVLEAVRDYCRSKAKRHHEPPAEKESLTIDLWGEESNR